MMANPEDQALNDILVAAAWQDAFAAGAAAHKRGAAAIDVLKAAIDAIGAVWANGAGMRMWIIEDFERFEGKLYGNGQCPQICQLHGGVPHSSTWVEGPKVRGNIGIPRGAAIATFIGGRYPSHAHGNHVAIYIEQDEVTGVRVFDQWKGKKSGAGYRWLKWGDGVSDRSNDGAAMSVILTPRPAVPKPKAKAKAKAGT
jgi:hypothetical protein